MTTAAPASTFGATPLDEKELPSFLSRAAARAHRRTWKDKTALPESLRGSPGFKPSAFQAQQVEKLRALGSSPKEISTILGVELSLLQFYYKYELDTAKARTVVSVAKVALNMALSGQDSAMTKFWLKTQGGWKETDVHEHTGLDAAADEARRAREKLIGGGVSASSVGGEDAKD